ncbi:MAG: hypothetical protein VR68_01440 [Peptococcaceae bacterium BRH_c4a]|nr:MAG: hypothetical protein VR68_10625 [Peptococcaceae bacterium BRH_c4a]KJS03455.1 MAG: hypothetical protein VR68_01440 [Peptococcaceae bacterium BRH_c4a]
MQRGGGVLVQADVPEAVIWLLATEPYGLPNRLQDAAGSRNRRMDAALEAVGSPLGDELRASSAGG